ncbi:hypothetical protein [Frondihabitans australicus]|uniref:Cytoskeletal protein CcmA (Bactofilin family) n=1 Tax=Frondihabitans australicus TaxID=386892 RepID=A0A495IL04_9MICO|nr:hypothetical protein [Frondihabitans australicus]RKR76118.1 hypothetical protein C8E83_3283 [Frondihabitans australicus]
MKKLTGVMAQALTIDEPVVLTGTAPHGILVCDGGSLDLRGGVDDRLTIEPGGYVLLSGSCQATVSIHEGGLLEVAGTLSGAVSRNDGELWAMSGSCIHGRTLSAAGFFIDLEADATPQEDAPRFRLTGTGHDLGIAD